MPDAPVTTTSTPALKPSLSNAAREEEGEQTRFIDRFLKSLQSPARNGFFCAAGLQQRSMLPRRPPMTTPKYLTLNSTETKLKHINRTLCKTEDVCAAAFLRAVG